MMMRWRKKRPETNIMGNNIICDNPPDLLVLARAC